MAGSVKFCERSPYWTRFGRGNSRFREYTRKPRDGPHCKWPIMHQAHCLASKRCPNQFVFKCHDQQSEWRHHCNPEIQFQKEGTAQETWVLSELSWSDSYAGFHIGQRFEGVRKRIGGFWLEVGTAGQGQRECEAKLPGDHERNIKLVPSVDEEADKVDEHFSAPAANNHKQAFQQLWKTIKRH